MYMRRDRVIQSLQRAFGPNHTQAKKDFRSFKHKECMMSRGITWVSAREPGEHDLGEQLP